MVVRGEVDRLRVGRPGGLARPPVQPGEQVGGIAAGDGHDHQGRVAGLVVAVVGPGRGDDQRAIRRDVRVGEIAAGVGQQGAALAGGRLDHRELHPQLGHVVPDCPAGDGPRAVGRQVGGLLVQRPAGPRGQVTGRPGQPAVGGHGHQQPRLIGAQVVIPVPDRRGLMQDRAHPGVLAPLAALRILIQPGRPRQQRGGEQQAGGAAGGDDPAGTARRGGDPAGVATRRGQQP
jgi:hypothetical protein